MRAKLGMAVFVVLLVAVWGVGFLWVRGDFDSSADKPVAGVLRPSARADPSASPSPATTPSATTPSASAAGRVYTGHVAPADERRAVDINPVRVRPRPQVLPPIARFTMATFNLLGSSHTRSSGKAPSKASGPQRIGGAVSILASHGVSVVGFQEFQGDQRRAFAGRSPGWAIFPGDTIGRGDGENSVAWRTDTWELVKSASVSIPYFNGRPRQMPYVLLRDKKTGVRAYFSNFHNPADTRRFRHQGRFRAEATSREISLFNQLEGSGIPQFVTGDMNDRGGYFCRVTAATPLIAAAGGSNDRGCVPPRPTQIDWILGSRQVQFSGYSIDRSALVRRTTDHAVVTTQVTIDALKFKNAYDPKASARAG